MFSVPLIDELRDTRRRLADECASDLDRYAEMLRQVSERIPGQYIRLARKWQSSFHALVQ